MSASITHTIPGTLTLSSGKVVDWPTTLTIEVRHRTEVGMQAVITYAQNGDQPEYRVGHVIGEIRVGADGLESTAQAEITAIWSGELDALPIEQHATLNDAVAVLADFYEAGIDRADAGDPYLTRAQWRAETAGADK